MSPEVARYLPYNLSADIYSFGVLLWQLYSMEMPFETMSRSAHSHLVVYGGERPRISTAWPESLANLMMACWEEAPYKRPTMSQVTRALANETSALLDGGDCSNHDRRAAARARSGSFVLNRDNIAEQPKPVLGENKKTRKFVDKVFQRLPSKVNPAIVA